MAVRSGFFNSVNGDRRYNAAFFAEYFASFIANGVFPNPAMGLQVIAGDNMQTIVKPGRGWINGYYINNDSDYILQHDIADSVLKRIDRIVMRLNYLTRQIEISIKKGTPASNPVAPSLQRNTDAYELALADVLINNGAIQITQANITDLRLNTSLCGIVHALIDQVDTTTIFNQYQAWFNSIRDGVETDIEDWEQQVKQDFLEWFQTIQDILDGDIAANLAAKITNLEQDFASHQAEKATLQQAGHVQLTNDVSDSESLAATPKAIRKSVEQTDYQIVKSEKDDNGVFTTVEARRNDGTLAIKSVLSGGESPNYTTRTIIYYALDGTTVEKTVTRTLTYDDDGDLVSEV